jgi:hypothetical protein
VLPAVLAAIGGCAAAPEPDPEMVIRGWSRAVNAGDYDRAGAFFARNAVVEQVEEIRLEGPADGARFSASLPCRADVTRPVAEQRPSLAIFRLRNGRSRCSGPAEVRFAVRDGKLTEWRQLPPPPPAQGLRAFSPTRAMSSAARSADGPAA